MATRAIGTTRGLWKLVSHRAVHMSMRVSVEVLRHGNNFAYSVCLMTPLQNGAHKQTRIAYRSGFKSEDAAARAGHRITRGG